MTLSGKIIETYVGIEDDESLALGKRLQMLRKLAGLTQADLSNKLKISQGALSRLENRTDIHVSTVKQYVEALGARLQIRAAFLSDHPISFRVTEILDTDLVDERQLLLPAFENDVFRPQRDVVLSIKPQYSSKIIEGTKTIELRRRFPINVPQGTLAFIYSTTPEKALIGYAEIVSVTKEPISHMWHAHKEEACISKRDFESYFSGQDFGFALRFRSARSFKQAIDLTELRERFSFEPPQSFLYAKPALREALRHELAELSH